MIFKSNNKGYDDIKFFDNDGNVHQIILEEVDMSSYIYEDDNGIYTGGSKKWRKRGSKNFKCSE